MLGLKWMPQNTFDGKSAWFQVIALYHQAMNHIRPNGEPVLCCHLASLGINELNKWNIHITATGFPLPLQKIDSVSTEVFCVNTNTLFSSEAIARGPDVLFHNSRNLTATEMKFSIQYLCWTYAKNVVYLVIVHTILTLMSPLWSIPYTRLCWELMFKY